MQFVLHTFVLLFNQIYIERRAMNALAASVFILPTTVNEIQFFS